MKFTSWITSFHQLASGKSRPLSNDEIVEIYLQKNREAASSIEQKPQADIITETRKIAPMVSAILEKSWAILDGKLTKLDLQHFILNEIKKDGLLPAMVGYNGFPAAIPISLNHEIIHNIPDQSVIKPNSLTTIEVGVSTGKAYASQTWTHGLKDLRLRNACKHALKAGITQVAPSTPINQIGLAISETINSAGFSVVEDYCGYGMGKNRIQDPQILGYDGYSSNKIPLMKAGDIYNIQVIANAGKKLTRLNMKNNWGVISKDRSQSAALSAMVLVTKDGAELLTKADM